MPKVKSRKPNVSRINAGSWKGRTRSSGVIFFGRGGWKLRTVRLATMSSARTKKPQVRIAQPKPTSLIRRVTMIGNITPPILDPVATTPKAAPILVLNQPWIALSAAETSSVSTGKSRRCTLHARGVIKGGSLTWLEDGGNTKSRTHALGEHYLPVLGAKRRHHDTEYMKKGANQYQLSRAVTIVQDANNRSLL